MTKEKNKTACSEGLTKGQQCKEIRKRLGLKQKQIAALLKVSKNAYSDWENDKYSPNDNHWMILTSLQDLRINTNAATQIAFLKNLEQCPVCQKKAEEYIHRFYEILLGTETGNK